MNDDLRAHLIARGEESILQDPSPDSFIHLLLMKVTNFEIIERGCCCFLEIKLISTWNVNKKHMSENTWIVYTVIFFRIGIPWYSSPLNSPPFERPSLELLFSIQASLTRPGFLAVSVLKSISSCGIWSIRVQPGRILKRDDRRPTSFQVHEMTFPDGAAPPEAVFFFPFFRSLLKQGSLYKVYPFFGGGESNNYNANLW